MMLGLRASNIWKGYNGNQILQDCSFSFAEQGVYILTGPNGCGKSTFLRICALIEAPDRGEIIYLSNGNMMQTDLGLRRRITLMLPKVGVFNTTVFKNVAYGLRIRGVKGNEREGRVNRALEFVGMSHKSNQNARTLSSGETQRLGIARALVTEPEVLFLDEPTASVDQKNTQIIEDIILQMKEKHPSVVIVTTHDRAQAERLADHLLIMREGKIARIESRSD
jgi:tungstate transport system ATP-binding protein